jgi:hypothetical protein
MALRGEVPSWGETAGGSCPIQGRLATRKLFRGFLTDLTGEESVASQPRFFDGHRRGKIAALSRCAPGVRDFVRATEVAVTALGPPFAPPMHRHGLVRSSLPVFPAARRSETTRTEDAQQIAVFLRAPKTITTTCERQVWAADAPTGARTARAPDRGGKRCALTFARRQPPWLPPRISYATRRLVGAELSANHLVHGELLDVWWTLWLDPRRRHPFHDPWSEGIEVSA